ncbi:ferredoxin [Streptomyces sp. NPDC058000]|uniref:ferredoxin n=1 Tax=Streptomyces sp. NPDC058000 TaxID=3346299 RepID=UPI0036E9D1A0
MTHVAADPDRCIGAGRCVSIAPALFDQTDDGEVVVLRSSPDREELPLVREAVDLCPGRALSVSAD